MKLLPDVFCEVYCLVSQNGYRFAHVLVDADCCHLLPLETINRAGWDLDLVADDPETVVQLVNSHQNLFGNVFPTTLPIDPVLLLTYRFWQCACQTAFVHHDLETFCHICGATEDQKRGMRFFELIADNIERTLDMQEVKQGLHILH